MFRLEVEDSQSEMPVGKEGEFCLQSGECRIALAPKWSISTLTLNTYKGESLR
jgi:hypothetical protein